MTPIQADTAGSTAPAAKRRRQRPQFRKAIAATTVLLSVATTAACGSEDTADSAPSNPSAATEVSAAGAIFERPVPEVQANEPYEIYLLAAHQSDQWAKSAAQAAQMYAEEHGANITILDAGGYSEVQKQISQIGTAIAQQPDAIMIWATDPTAITPTLERAVDAGIQVTNFVVASALDVPTVTGDYVAQGKQMGEALANSMGGSGKIISVIGGQGGFYASSLHDGLEQALTAFPDIEWAKDTMIANFDPGETQQTVQNWLTGNPDTNGIFVTTGAQGVGAAQGVRAAGMDDGSVKLVGSLLPDCSVVDTIRENRFSLLLGDPAVTQGQLGAAMTIGVLNGDQVENLQIPATNIYTPDNIDQAADDGVLFEEIAPEFITDCVS